MSGMQQVGKKIRQVASSVVRIELGTTVSNNSISSQTQVILDSDPSRTPVVAKSILGPVPAGIRVSCLVYPPRGLLVLGMSGDNTALQISRLRLAATNDVSLSSTLHALQIGPSTGTNLRIDNNEIEAVINGARAPLYLNNDAGSVVSPEMRVGWSTDSGNRTTASTTPVNAGITAEVAFVWPTSDTVRIEFSSRLNNNATAAADAAVLGWEIRTAASGGGSQVAISADPQSAIIRGAPGPTTCGRSIAVDSAFITGTLGGSAPTVGTTYYCRPMLRTNNAANAAFALHTWLLVHPSL